MPQQGSQSSLKHEVSPPYKGIGFGLRALESGFQGLNSRFFFSETWISDSIVSGIPDP